MIYTMLFDDEMLSRQAVKLLVEQENDVTVVEDVATDIDCMMALRNKTPDLLLINIHDKNRTYLNVLDRIEELRFSIRILILCSLEYATVYKKYTQSGFVQGIVLKDESYINLKHAMQEVYLGESFYSEKYLEKISSENQFVSKEDEMIQTLTDRELDVLKRLSFGESNKEIAEQLLISERTVKNHVFHIFKKLRVTDRTQAAVFAIRNNIISL